MCTQQHRCFRHPAHNPKRYRVIKGQVYTFLSTSTHYYPIIMQSQIATQRKVLTRDANYCRTKMSVLISQKRVFFCKLCNEQKCVSTSTLSGQCKRCYPFVCDLQSLLNEALQTRIRSILKLARSCVASITTTATATTTTTTTTAKPAASTSTDGMAAEIETMPLLFDYPLVFRLAEVVHTGQHQRQRCSVCRIIRACKGKKTDAVLHELSAFEAEESDDAIVRSICKRAPSLARQQEHLLTQTVLPSVSVLKHPLKKRTATTRTAVRLSVDDFFAGRRYTLLDFVDRLCLVYSSVFRAAETMVSAPSVEQPPSSTNEFIATMLSNAEAIAARIGLNHGVRTIRLKTDALAPLLRPLETVEHLVDRIVVASYMARGLFKPCMADVALDRFDRCDEHGNPEPVSADAADDAKEKVGAAVFPDRKGSSLLQATVASLLSVKFALCQAMNVTDEPVPYVVKVVTPTRTLGHFCTVFGRLLNVDKSDCARPSEFTVPKMLTFVDRVKELLSTLYC